MHTHRWSTADLENLLGWLETKDAPQGDPTPAPGRVGTVQIVRPIVSAILSYHRALLKIWTRTVQDLESLAGDPAVNRFGGYQLGDERGDTIIHAAVTNYLREARERYAKAYTIGEQLALRSTDKSRVSQTDKERAIHSLLDRNEQHVIHSLFADLRDRYREILRDESLPAPDAAVEMARWGEAREFRAGDLYSRKLWGAAHKGFAAEMAANQRLMRWVLTSTNPCVDCPRLQAHSPYGPLNPLPTVPGQGDTQCRTNCLCLLVEVDRVTGQPPEHVPEPHPVLPAPHVPRPHVTTEAVSPSSAPTAPLDKAVYSMERRIRDRETEAGAFFAGDGTELWKGVGERNYMDFPTDRATYDRLQAAGPLTFTHNHPRGTAPSLVDVGNVFNYRVNDRLGNGLPVSQDWRLNYASMRAAGAQYRYNIFATDAVPLGNPDTFTHTIRPVFLRVDQEVGDYLRPLTISGQITTEEAEMLHNHLVWSQVVEETGLGYQRERWFDAVGVRTP